MLTIGFKIFDAPIIGWPVVVVYFTVLVVVVVVVEPVVPYWVEVVAPKAPKPTLLLVFVE